jgi:hypothetical protein
MARRFGLWVYVLGPVAGLTVVDQTFTPPPPPSLRHRGQGGVLAARVVMSAALWVPPGGWPMPGGNLCRVGGGVLLGGGDFGLGARHCYRFSWKASSLSGGR